MQTGRGRPPTTLEATTGSATAPVAIQDLSDIPMILVRQELAAPGSTILTGYFPLKVRLKQCADLGIENRFLPKDKASFDDNLNNFQGNLPEGFHRECCRLLRELEHPSTTMTGGQIRLQDSKSDEDLMIALEGFSIRYLGLTSDRFFGAIDAVLIQINVTPDDIERCRTGNKSDWKALQIRIFNALLDAGFTRDELMA